MENIIKFEMTDEANGEQNSIFIPETYCISTVMEISSTELDQSTVDTKADNQQSKEISLGLEEEREDSVQGIFGPFSHNMRPNLELIRLELEKSASNQEAATKLINDRYKWIMELSERRKEKEQKDKIKFTQISQNVDHEDFMKTFRLSDNAGIEDIEKTTQLLHNMQLTSGSFTKDRSEKFSDDHLEEMCWHYGPNQFIKWNAINSKAYILDDDMPITVAEDRECIEGETLKNTANELKDKRRRKTLYRASRNSSSAKRKKARIGSSFEELLDYERFQSLYEM